MRVLEVLRTYTCVDIRVDVRMNRCVRVRAFVDVKYWES